jgi:hypothetical protein
MIIWAPHYDEIDTPIVIFISVPKGTACSRLQDRAVKT